MVQMFKTLMNDPKAAMKFIVALIGAVLTAVTLGLLPAAVGDWTAVLIAFLTALGVYAVPNKQ